MTMTEAAMRQELLRLMPVRANSDWGPNPFVCRWCQCWLEYGDTSVNAPKPEEQHSPTCFAVTILGRPTK